MSGIYQSTPEGQFLQVNQRLAHILGYSSPTELLSGAFDIEADYYVDPQVRPQLKHLLQERDMIQGIEYQAYRKDGTQIWVLETTRAIRGESGAVLYYEGIIEDITERRLAETALRQSHSELEQRIAARMAEVSRANDSLKEQVAERRRAEAALQASEERYRAFVENSSEAIWRFELRGSIPVELAEEEQIELIYQSGYLAECNDAMAQMYGLARASDIVGSPLELLLPRTDPQNIAYLLAFIRSGYRLIEAESHELDAEGNRKQFLNNLVGVIENGRLCRAWGTQRDITESKRAEEALRTSERKLRLMAENVTEVMYAYDMERRLIYVNPAVRELTGYDASELREQGFIPWVHHDDLERMMSLWEPLYAGRGYSDEEYRIITRSGQLKYCLGSWGPLYDETGKQIGVQGRESDITERKRVEIEGEVLSEIIQGVNTTDNLDELLRLIHQALKRVLYAENCFVALYERATALLSMQFFVDQYDVAPPPLKLGNNRTSYVFRTDRSILMTAEVFERLVEAGEVESFGTPPATWLGVPLKTPAETIGVLVLQHYEDPLAYSESDLNFLSSVGSQIALAIERKRAEEALRHAEQRAIIEYSGLLERVSTLAQTLGTARDMATTYRALRDFALVSAPCDGILISLYDAERSLRSLTYGWADGIEVDLGQIPSTPVGNGIVGRAIKSQTIALTGSYQEELKKGYHYFVDPEGNQKVPESLLAVPMITTGRTIGIIEIQCYEPAAYREEHCTAMRMAANLVAIAIENVRLIEREREQEEQLRQSQKMEAIGQLAGGVAHDFNNLLTGINGYSDLALRRLPAGDPLRRNLEEIKKGGDRAAALTRQLLAFSRKQVLKPKVLNLNSVVSDMFRMLQRLIGEDIDLLPVLDPMLGQVKADPGQLEQVLMNLCVNARDAMPRGGKLTLGTTNVHLDEAYASRHVAVRPGAYVMLSVSDTGHGMGADTQRHIFEPFFTTKDVGKGTGLGLSTVYGIVKQSGGNIWVYSEVGKGTTFKIYLPRVDEVSRTPEAAINHTDFPLGTETVLLVEDEEMVRNMTHEILSMSGYRVLEAKHGRDAVEVSEQYEGPIHLLLTDVVMPQMGGRELAQKLAPLRPEMHILYMSGYTDDAIVHHGVLDEGMSFIEKPFSPESIIRKVREVLETTQ